jgi:serine/threonine-protein kinase
LAVSPAPGKDVKERGIVNVVVSAGSTYVQMPDLKGETIDKARTILENLNLSPDAITEQRASSEVEFGRVLATDPPAKSKVLRASRVKLIISAGSVASPSEIGKSYVYTLRIDVTGTTERTNVRVEISDIQGARTVYEASHEPNDEFEFEATGFGSSATFRIYYDEVLQKEFEQIAQPD